MTADWDLKKAADELLRKAESRDTDRKRKRQQQDARQRRRNRQWRNSERRAGFYAAEELRRAQQDRYEAEKAALERAMKSEQER